MGRYAKKKNILCHCDAVHPIGKIEINVNDLNIDLISISGHKIYGSKGVGALYVPRKPRVRIQLLFSGGGQERGLRSESVPTPLVVGLGKGTEICKEEIQKDFKWISHLSNKLFDYSKSSIPDVLKNGSFSINSVKWFPGCLNLSFPHVEKEGLLMSLKNIALSSGSACTSASLEPSYVLRALGKDDELAHSSIRFAKRKIHNSMWLNK